MNTISRPPRWAITRFLVATAFAAGGTLIGTTALAVMVDESPDEAPQPSAMLDVDGHEFSPSSSNPGTIHWWVDTPSPQNAVATRPDGSEVRWDGANGANHITNCTNYGGTVTSVHWVLDPNRLVISEVTCQPSPLVRLTSMKECPEVSQDVGSAHWRFRNYSSVGVEWEHQVAGTSGWTTGGALASGSPHTETRFTTAWGPQTLKVRWRPAGSSLAWREVTKAAVNDVKSGAEYAEYCGNGEPGNGEPGNGGTPETGQPQPEITPDPTADTEESQPAPELIIEPEQREEVDSQSPVPPVVETPADPETPVAPATPAAEAAQPPAAPTPAPAPAAEAAPMMLPSAGASSGLLAAFGALLTLAGFGLHRFGRQRIG